MLKFIFKFRKRENIKKNITKKGNRKILFHVKGLKDLLSFKSF